jgi:transcriptional regulator with XRE-family HTH domain
MKKTFSVEEVAEIVNKIQLLTGDSFQTIASKIGVSVAMISKWKNGKLPISEKNFLRLKSLAEGTLAPVVHQHANPPPQEYDDMRKRVLMLEERVLYLEKQVRESFENAKQANPVRSVAVPAKSK